MGAVIPTLSHAIYARLIESAQTRLSDVFAAHGMWCARVSGYDDVLTDPQLVANQSILDFEDPAAIRRRRGEKLV